MSRERRVVRGILAGMVGGLVASWVMNEFMKRAGQKLQEAVQTEEQNKADREQEKAAENQPKEDATMKAADLIVNEVTGGRHLSWKAKERGGPIVHYVFGAIMGGVYGGVAEVAPSVTTGTGISFGTVLFTGADLIAVPALGLSQSSTAQPMSKLTSPTLLTLCMELQQTLCVGYCDETLPIRSCF